jgi:hypothetical protein
MAQVLQNDLDLIDMFEEPIYTLPSAPTTKNILTTKKNTLVALNSPAMDVPIHATTPVHELYNTFFKKFVFYTTHSGTLRQKQLARETEDKINIAAEIKNTGSMKSYNRAVGVIYDYMDSCIFEASQNMPKFYNRADIQSIVYQIETAKISLHPSQFGRGRYKRLRKSMRKCMRKRGCGHKQTQHKNKKTKNKNKNKCIYKKTVCKSNRKTTRSRPRATRRMRKTRNRKRM